MLRFEPTYNRFGHRHLLSRAAAFRAQGVNLADPSRSWGGQRADGSVVFAIPERAVREHEGGYCSLLFSEAASLSAGPAGDPERLGHCRLALRQGGAGGLLASGLAGKVRGNAVLALALEERDGEFWALWGAATRAVPGCTVVPSHSQAPPLTPRWTERIALHQQHG